MSATAASDWPTPTVSTITRSKPAASQASSASRVRRATPPRVPPAGEARMKLRSLRASAGIRVLSPRIEPPERALEGSIASTASRLPVAMRARAEGLDEGGLAHAWRARDAEAHGPPACGSSAWSSASARSRSSSRVDSMRVIAAASARRSPARMAATGGAGPSLPAPSVMACAPRRGRGRAWARAPRRARWRRPPRGRAVVRAPP